MCGLSGFLTLATRTADELTATVRSMSDTLRQRGPDDAGCWVDAQAGIALGHRRLSIVDLSPQGHQPMSSVSGRYVIAFNGEIYNHRALRDALAREGAAPQWRGHSDTEVMLAAIEHWGLEQALHHFNGMFAFALWDQRARVLHLARDRFGEKPLYYGWMGDTFLFGSELKALKAHPHWRGEIDQGALALYMRHNYIPAPYSIYQRIHKLPPAHWLSVPLRDGRGAMPEPKAYWSVRAVAEAGCAHPYAGVDGDAIEQLDALLSDAVALRMEADVPLGAFLSGGIDSSTVVALMQKQATRPVRTFSIGFDEAGYNEAQHAKAVAQHLGTQHTELYVSPEQAMQVIPRLPFMYDEPFADSSQIPTFLVAQMTRQHVTVALSGDAGDELFGGYNRYLFAQALWRRLNWLPAPLRKAAAHALRAWSPQQWDRAYALFRPILPRRLRVSLAGDKVHKLAGVLAYASPEEMYRKLVSHWEPAQLVLGANEPATILTDHARWAEVRGLPQRMMFLDQQSYLPDDILVKVDRASMAVSLEARVPMLDHRVAEFAWQLPQHMKIRNGEGKWLLRQVLYRHVPRSLMERPKMGFGVPIDMWLRGPLRDWAESLLDEATLRGQGYLDAAPIRAKWEAHLSGRHNWAYHLWDVLMWQAWLEQERRP
ncbi:MAG TPA: asparagine synthase (glutamine-hydrolyzing) [Gallionellaceae bacterium]